MRRPRSFGKAELELEAPAVGAASSASVIAMPSSSSVNSVLLATASVKALTDADVGAVFASSSAFKAWILSAPS